MQKSRFSRTWTAALAGAALLVAGVSPVLGQAGTPAAPAAGALPADIAKALEARGYTAIRDVEFDDGVWELEATSPAGKPVDLTVDTSGKVLHEEADDDD